MADDTISRQAAIDAIRELESGEDFNFNNGLICAMNNVAELPTAERKGHWIMLTHRKAKCSSCGVVEYTNGIDLTMSGCIFYATKPYCPHCGARMESEE